MELRLNNSRRQWTLIAAVVAAFTLLLVALGHPVAGQVIAYAAVLVLSRASPDVGVAGPVDERQDRRNAILIAQNCLWVSRQRRQSLVEAGTPEARAAFVAWQFEVLMLFVLLTFSGQVMVWVARDLFI
jgi:hypothetical protein